MLCLLLAGLTTRPSIDAEALLTKTRDAYAHLKSVKMAVIVKSPIAPGERAITPIEVSYQAPKSLRIDLSLPSGLRYRATMNGAEVAIQDFKNTPYRAKLNDRNKLGWFPLSTESEALTMAPTALATNSVSQAGKETYAGQEYLSLTMKPDDKKGTRKLLIDPKTCLVMHVFYWSEGKTETESEQHVKTISINPSFEAGYFDLPAKPN